MRWIADVKARLFARWVAGASTARLERVMRSPLRRVLLRQVFQTMRRRFEPARADGVDAVVEFRIRRSGGGPADRFQVVIADGRCTTSRSGDRRPSVTLDMGSATFLRLVGGASPAPKLMLQARLWVWGDLVLATRLPDLLNIPKA